MEHYGLRSTEEQAQVHNGRSRLGKGEEGDQEKGGLVTKGRQQLGRGQEVKSEGGIAGKVAGFGRKVGEGAGPGRAGWPRRARATVGHRALLCSLGSTCTG